MSAAERHRRRTRLASRVVRAAATSAALAGTLAAVSTVLAVDHLVGRLADRRLAGAAEILAGELDEEFEEDKHWEPVGEIVADENGELVTSGIRLAVFSSGHRIAGDPWVRPAPAGECSTHGGLGSRARACGRAYRDWVLVAAARSDEAALRWIYALAAGGSLLLGALFAAAVSLRLSRWALSPLHALRQAIGRLQPSAANPAQLGPRSDCEEIEVIRDALADLLQRSQDLLGQSQRFAANAAHELRTPLTTMRGEIDLLIEDARGDAEREALLRVSRRAKQLGDLVARLLVLASPLSTERERFETVELSQIIEEVVAELDADERARVRLDLATDGLVRGDPALLRSMLANALDNALKFSRGQPVEVTLTAQPAAASTPDAHAIRVEVHDRGPGVDAQQRERVFEPFFRAQPAVTPGHGLGLSLIGHIARAHGGRAEFVDAPSGGACLRLILPEWAALNDT